MPDAASCASALKDAAKSPPYSQTRFGARQLAALRSPVGRQNGFGVAQSAETRLSQCGCGGKFFLLIQRQDMQDGFNPFQGCFVRLADFGQLGLYPAVQTA